MKWLNGSESKWKTIQAFSFVYIFFFFFFFFFALLRHLATSCVDMVYWFVNWIYAELSSVSVRVICCMLCIDECMSRLNDWLTWIDVDSNPAYVYVRYFTVLMYMKSYFIHFLIGTNFFCLRSSVCCANTANEHFFNSMQTSDYIDGKYMQSKSKMLLNTV